MQEQRTAVAADVPGLDEIEQVVLETLLERHPALVAIEELQRDLGQPSTAGAIPAVFIAEAVDDLVRSGLAHRLERFVFASWSAVRSRALQT